MDQKINLKEKCSSLPEYWTPEILGESDRVHIKIFKGKGEFIWHKHPHEEEIFLVLKGELVIKLRDRDIELKEGELFAVGKDVEHMPVAKDEAFVLVIEPIEIDGTKVNN
jgi:mannose-6-phosphate isomerase-like protein (cupin superfamily)